MISAIETKGPKIESSLKFKLFFEVLFRICFLPISFWNSVCLACARSCSIFWTSSQAEGVEGPPKAGALDSSTTVSSVVGQDHIGRLSTGGSTTSSASMASITFSIFEFSAAISSPFCNEAPISMRTEFSSGAPVPRQVAISTIVFGFSWPMVSF